MMSGPDDMAALVAEMRRAAVAFTASLSPRQRAEAAAPLDVTELMDWTYLPGPRPGVRVAELSTEQRGLAESLWSTCYGPRGWEGAAAVIRTEAIQGGYPLDPAASSLLASYAEPPYWLRILGDPAGAAPWAWRLSGHHLLAQATLVGDVVSGTPQFFGVSPARVRSGGHAGYRGLPQEEDLARGLMHLFGEDQRTRALLSARAPADIQTRHDPIATVDPAARGLRRSEMDAEQRQSFDEVIRQYLDRAPAAIANRAWSDLTDAGLDSVTFGWAGGLAPGEPHYYSVCGPTFLLEYDNTQDDANHIHSVWRDLRHDWAGDLLARHYRTHDHPDGQRSAT